HFLSLCVQRHAVLLSLRTCKVKRRRASPLFPKHCHFLPNMPPGTLLYPRAIWSIWLSIRTVMVFPLQTAFTVLLRGKRAGLIFGTLTLLPDRKSTYAAVPTATITMKAVPPGFPIFLDDNWPFR